MLATEGDEIRGRRQEERHVDIDVGDQSARRLVPMIRAWPQESAYARAEIGLDVLRGIGTDVALMHLNGMAQKLKSKALQERAQERLNDIAERRGLSVDELADRLVPDFDLEPDGTRILEFGSRQFRVTFDELLRPIVLGPEGQQIKDLPKPGQHDDAALAASAVGAFKAMKKDLKAISTIQVERLEQAMRSQRCWTWPAFRLLLLEHPLMIHLTRRLLWQAIDHPGGGVTTFRVAEDGTLADADDDLYVPNEAGDVRLLHPVFLATEESKSWRDRFADYTILQPFVQLNRPCYQLAESCQADTEITIVEGLKLHPGKVIGLTSRGWVKGEAWRAGVIPGMEKALPNGLRAVLPLDPGIYAGALTELGEQTLGRVTVIDRSDQVQALSRLGTIDYSELVHDLVGLR